MTHAGKSAGLLQSLRYPVCFCVYPVWLLSSLHHFSLIAFPHHNCSLSYITVPFTCSTHHYHRKDGYTFEYRWKVQSGESPLQRVCGGGNWSALSGGCTHVSGSPHYIKLGSTPTTTSFPKHLMRPHGHYPYERPSLAEVKLINVGSEAASLVCSTQTTKPTDATR